MGNPYSLIQTLDSSLMPLAPFMASYSLLGTAAFFLLAILTSNCSALGYVHSYIPAVSKPGKKNFGDNLCP